MLYGSSGISSVAHEVCGTERIDMGVRPFGFHAGNIASTIVYMELLCRKTAQLGKDVNFHVSFCLSDTEQHIITGHPNAPDKDDEANIYPKGKTLQYTESVCEGVTVVDAWKPLYKVALETLTKKWPGISWDMYKTSQLVHNETFLDILTRTIHDPDPITSIIESATGKKVHKPADFVRAVCPWCNIPASKTTISPKKQIKLECSDCLRRGTFLPENLDYWTHHAIAIVGEWACLEKYDIGICGYDHYAIGSERLWLGLAKHFGCEEKILDTLRLYSPLVLSYDGRKMGKSNGNMCYADIDKMANILETFDGLSIKLPQRTLSSNIRDIGIPIPKRLLNT